MPTTPYPALAPAPALFDVTTLTDTGIDGTLARRPLEQLELAENPRKTISADGIERLAAMLDAPRPTRRPASAGAQRPTSPSALYDGQRRLLAAQASQRLAGTRRLRGPRAGAQPDRAAARPRARPRGDPAHPSPGQPQRGTRARRPAGPVRRLLAGPRRPARSRPDRRRLRRPRHLAQEGAQPPPPAHAPRSDPRPRRRAPRRRPAVGHARQPPRRHARDRARAHRGGRDAHHQHRAARRRAARPRRLRAPHARRGRARLRRAHRRRRAARRRRADRARPRPADRRPTGDSSPRILDCPPDKLDARARRARRPRPHDGAASCASTARCASAPRTGRYAYVHERGPDFAAGIWVIDPVFMLDAIREQLDRQRRHAPRASRATSPAPASTTHELRAAGEQDRAQRADARARQIEATRSQPRPRPRPARRR